jgi:hypothetical protein
MTESTDIMGYKVNSVNFCNEYGSDCESACNNDPPISKIGIQS